MRREVTFRAEDAKVLRGFPHLEARFQADRVARSEAALPGGATR